MRGLILKYSRVIKFGIVGCINTAVDFLVFCVASAIFGFTPAVAQGFGYCSGIVCSFILNHAVTFSDAKKESARGVSARAVRFIIVNAISFTVSVGAMAYLTHLGMWEYLAKVIITAVTMVINYVGYKIFVFKIKGERA